MPWPEKQRKAIFLETKRRKGEKAAKKLMHEAGYGGKSQSVGSSASKKKKKKK